MTGNGVIEGVYLSTVFDLEDMFARYFEPYAGEVRLRRPEAVDDPASVRFALAWHPATDAFAAYPSLCLAHSIAAGVDSIVQCPSLPDQAHVARVRDDSQGDLMAGFAAWHVIWHHRNMRHHIIHQARHEWARQDVAGFPSPRDCPVGILGFGLMGRAIARAVTAMGFPVVAAVRGAPASLPPAGVEFECGEGAIERVASRASMLINVLPLTAQTRGILNAKLFSAMPKGAVLIQLGRGEHMVEADFLAALDEGQISAASLDVFASEPLPPGHPFWDDERILVTPHQASDSSPRLMARQVVEAVREIAAGRRPVTAVDRLNGY
ncbi:NAD(P)-dependent oxidoreductase [Mesorhizobium xinjiangense]|uniref:NAD(P)-dependent oxidoreductase n=1 Tax=Mesorhizobium xinjiangense TaxID=2678685 RepID=UPI0012EE7628|nr:NAD(P)-dependent oxidoreductase [Mesorhizobium xinjiangense]